MSWLLQEFPKLFSLRPVPSSGGMTRFVIHGIVLEQDDLDRG
jgi:hypothetical protein